MSMLHIQRSTKPKDNKTSGLYRDSETFNKSVVHCLYNLVQDLKEHKTLSHDLVQHQLELVFDIDQIRNQVDKLSELVLGQCVNQV